MPDTLPVHLSREELHEIETVESFEATGSFTVEILNHGRDAHPHLKLSDSLAAIASIEEGNPYVASDESVRIRVDARRPPEPVTGILKIETGYGADAAGVQVTIRQPTEAELAADQPTDAATSASTDDESPAGGVGAPKVDLSSETLPVVALALVALVIAAGTAAVVEDLVVIAGVVVVLVAVVFAGVLLLR